MTRHSSSCAFVIVIFLNLLACRPSQPLGAEYFPLEVGATWQYQVISRDMDVTKKYKHFVVNVLAREVDGQQAYTRKINDEFLYFYQISDQGIRRLGRQRERDIITQFEEEDHFILKYPLQLGSQWQQQSITGVLEVVIAPFRRHYALHAPLQISYTISALNDSVTVAAGHFEDCIKVSGLGTTRVEADKSIGIVDVTVESTDWYCAHVGLVKSQRKESTSSSVLVKGDYSMELESFTAG